MARRRGAATPYVIAFAGVALLERQNFGVHVVRHGDGKEEKYKGERDSTPFLEAIPKGMAALMDPPCSPCGHEGRSDQQPQKIEQLFHEYGRVKRSLTAVSYHLSPPDNHR